MESISVIITSLISLIVLFFLTKIDGNRQISELTTFDYIVSITIGSIAAELATELENPSRPLIAMLIYGFISLSISFLTSKSIRIRRFMFGKSVVLMKGGRLYRKNFKRAKLDLSEFLMHARINGYFDISSIDTAILEPSGKISFLPLAAEAPATPKDLKIVPEGSSLFFNVIMDGDILDKNLKAAGKDRRWLDNELKLKGTKLEEVFLAVLDCNGTLNIFKDTDTSIKNDFFQ